MPTQLIDGVRVEITQAEYDALFPPPPPPSADPDDYPLLPWQFKAMVTYLDKDAEIRAAIATIPDALQKAVALSRYENATSYRHNDAFLQSMRVAIGMTEQTLSDAWMLAKDLTS
jgi:DNA-directed RNA polymerase specialized sigma24 family protein